MRLSKIICMSGVIHLNEKDELGRTPLIRAVIQHKPEVVQYLLDEGASPHIRDDTSLTALEYAHIHGYIQIAKMIAERMMQPHFDTKR